MLWVIDIGNTHTVVGLHEGGWKAVWRLETERGATEDQIVATLSKLCELVSLPLSANGVIIGSVVPSVNSTWRHFAEKWLKTIPKFLLSGADVGLVVTYDPPGAVGADRIANALGAIERYGSPVIVVDFGTATTFDVIDNMGHYVGGAILPGVQISMEALAQRAAKLPSISLEPPQHAIGRNTVDALRSGVMYGYAGSVDSVCRRIAQELGGKPSVVATGGLAPAFERLCETVQSTDRTLTLDGLVIAFRHLAAGS